MPLLNVGNLEKRLRKIKREGGEKLGTTEKECHLDDGGEERVEKTYRPCGAEKKGTKNRDHWYANKGSADALRFRVRLPGERPGLDLGGERGEEGGDPEVLVVEKQRRRG